MSNSTPVERCGHPTQDDTECSRHGTYPDGRCYQHTDHPNLLAESTGETVSYAKCSTCGKRFSTSADLREHRETHHPKRERVTQTARRAAERTKRGGSKAKAGGKKGIAYVFDEQGEKTALLSGVAVGMLWGHDPQLAYLIVASIAGLGTLGHETVRKHPKLPTEKIEVIRNNALTFCIGVAFSGVWIVAMHGEPNLPTGVPRSIPEVVDALYHLIGGHNH
jgi:hypothetical protein